MPGKRGARRLLDLAAVHAGVEPEREHGDQDGREQSDRRSPDEDQELLDAVLLVVDGQLGDRSGEHQDHRQRDADDGGEETRTTG